VRCSTNRIAPVVKWAGGKSQLLPNLLELIPKRFNLFVEPFLGGGAMTLSILPKHAILNDSNMELINMYKTVRDNVEELILKLGKFSNTSECFYNVRSWDREESYNTLDCVTKAARILYLNKTCYNGLFRVNSGGQFNAPFGRYKNPDFINEKGLIALSSYLNNPDICIKCGDYQSCIEAITKGTFVYIDPPYYPVSDTSNFTGYTGGGFNLSEQERLKQWCDYLDSNKVKFMQSNSYCETIKDLYGNYRLQEVDAKRIINSKADKRGTVKEYVIMNY